MVGTHSVGRSLAICAVVLGLTAMAAPATAQTGQLRGKVVDAQNKPVEGAKITIVQTDSNTKLEVKTKKGGEYLQIGLQPGNYKITAEKDGLKHEQTVRIGLDMKELDFTLKPGGGGTMSKEEAAKAAARVEGLRTAFAEGAALSNAGKHDEAIAKFNEVLTAVPKCTECYVNIGSVYAQKKDYVQSEAAFRKALELDPNSVEAYNRLATIFNDQKKFTEAQAMSAEASKRAAAVGGGGTASADSLYNAGVISWNATDYPKAHEQFAAAVAANPNHAEAHFMLGNALVKLGASSGDVAKFGAAATEFETYLKLAPNGTRAKEAQSNFEQLKQFIK